MQGLGFEGFRGLGLVVCRLCLLGAHIPVEVCVCMYVCMYVWLYVGSLGLFGGLNP